MIQVASSCFMQVLKLNVYFCNTMSSSNSKALLVVELINLSQLNFVLCFRMRNFQRKLERATKSENDYKLATRSILENRSTILKADVGFCLVSIFKYVIEEKKNRFRFCRIRQTKIRIYARAIDIKRKVPLSWYQTGMAGKYWFNQFINMNRRLRTPEATLLSSVAQFIQTSVIDSFFFKSMKRFNNTLHMPMVIVFRQCSIYLFEVGHLTA